MTPNSYYLLRIQADVISRRDELLQAFELSPDESNYWAFVDLVGSSNYRLTRGAQEGYVRGEEFYGLVYSAIGPYREIEAFKELGDGVLLSCKNLRPLFESCLLVVQTADNLAEVAGTKAFPFAVRVSISYGACKRLRMRELPDYIGSPIDEAARLNGAAKPNEILISHGAHQLNSQVLSDFADFATFGAVEQLSPQQSKNMVTPVRYRRALIDGDAFRRHEGGFAPWRSFAEPGPASESP
ncbi:MAG TPA: hypothetical protein VFN92_06470 [Solirubrobacterales bacterium]|nr:hypothetical protein [Solirubrobacterales bacterium]